MPVALWLDHIAAGMSYAFSEHASLFKTSKSLHTRMLNLRAQTKIRSKGCLNNQDLFQGMYKRRTLHRGLILKKKKQQTTTQKTHSKTQTPNFLQSLSTSGIGFPVPKLLFHFRFKHLHSELIRVAVPWLPE